MAEKLELKLFGNLEVRQADVLVTDLKSIKAQALLGYLAVTKLPQTRATLASLLWGDMPEAKARMNLSQALSTLRRFFGDHLGITRQTIALRQDRDLWVDVSLFEAKVLGSSDEVDFPALQAAVQLYRGDFLDNFLVPKAPEFEDWLMTERARLRGLALKTLQTLSVHYAAQGETGWEEALTYTARMLSIEPWQEEVHRLMMRLLALSGRRSAALKQFEECRRILAEELDVEPSPSTLRLLAKIRQGELDPRSVLDDFGEAIPIQSLPSTALRETLTSRHPLLAVPLIGRQRELAELSQRLTNSDARLVTIAGTGGIGKTHLATAVSLQISEKGSFRDGVYFVPLAHIATLSLLITTIAESFGLSLGGRRQPEEVLLAFLRPKACLLIIDNFEQLLGEVDFLVRLLQVAHKSKLLVTSRERLKLREEWVLDLEGLPYPDTIEEAQTSDYDAILLFSERARQIRSSFSLEKEISGVVRICQLTQGMPLALEQSAGLIRVSQAAEIADQIEARLDTLTTTLRNLPERHRSMRAVFDSSWQWLSKDEQIVFARLSVFRGSFSLGAAEQVAGATLQHLASLIDKSLLRIITGLGNNTRYELHELVRQYAAEKLLEAGQAQFGQVRSAHLDYYLSLAENAKQFWDTKQEKEWLERLELERGNLHAALRWAKEDAKVEHLLRLNAALVTFWIYNSPAGEASDWLESALSLARDNQSHSEMRARAEALIVAGHAALQISNNELAAVRFQEGEVLYSKLGDQRRQAWALRGSGFTCFIQGDLADAQTFLEKSLNICREIQSEWCLAWSLYELGNIAFARGDLAQAESLFDDAMGLFRQHGRELGTFRTLISQGHLRRAQGKWAQAKAFYKEALEIQQETNYIQFIAQILEGLAYLAVADDDLETAVQLLGAAQARRDSIEMTRWAHQEIEYQHNLEISRYQLPPTVWQAMWKKGYNLAPQDALEFANT